MIVFFYKQLYYFRFQLFDAAVTLKVKAVKWKQYAESVKLNKYASSRCENGVTFITLIYGVPENYFEVYTR